MFVHGVTYYPANGKAMEFRALAEQRVHELQKARVEANLSTLAWGPEYPSARISHRFATLAEYEKYRTANIEAVRKFATSVAPLLRQPSMTTLSETLQTTNQSGAAKWSQWVTSAPALDKGPEVRSLLVERGKQYDAQKRRTTLSVQVAGPESGLFTRVFSYGSLAELEEWRARGAADEMQAAYLHKLNALLSRPLQTSIREILIPYPQR